MYHIHRLTKEIRVRCISTHCCYSCIKLSVEPQRMRPNVCVYLWHWERFENVTENRNSEAGIWLKAQQKNSTCIMRLIVVVVRVVFVDAAAYFFSFTRAHTIALLSCCFFFLKFYIYKSQFLLHTNTIWYKVYRSYHWLSDPAFVIIWSVVRVAIEYEPTSIIAHCIYICFCFFSFLL